MFHYKAWSEKPIKNYLVSFDNMSSQVVINGLL